MQPIKPDFWQIPDSAVVNESKRNTTQWFHIVNKMADQICP